MPGQCRPALHYSSTDTNVSGDGSVKIRKTRHKLFGYTDIFYCIAVLMPRYYSVAAVTASSHRGLDATASGGQCESSVKDGIPRRRHGNGHRHRYPSSSTSSRGSSRECRRVVQLATEITPIARVGEDPREDVRVSASWNSSLGRASTCSMAVVVCSLWRRC